MKRELSIFCLVGMLVVSIFASSGFSQPKISDTGSNIALNKTFFSNKGTSGNRQYATDGDTTNWFWSFVGNEEDYIAVDLGQIYTSNRIFILQKGQYFVNEGELQYSLDRETWTSIIKTNSEQIDCKFESAIMQYFRVLVKKHQTKDVMIAEMQAFHGGIPDTIKFGNVKADEPREVTIPIYNEGDENLIISDITSDNISFRSIDTSLVVEPDSSKEITVVFEPQIGGINYGTLSFSSNDLNYPNVKINLAGFGITNIGPLQLSGYQKGSGYEIDDDNDNSPHDDSQGDNNGMINPGEDIRLLVGIKNTGLETAYNVLVTIHCNFDGITITDSVQHIDSIEGGEIKWIGKEIDRDAFQFSVSEAAKISPDVLFKFNISSSNAGLYKDELHLSISKNPEELWAPWPMWGRDFQHTGRCPFNVPDSVAVLWTLDIPDVNSVWCSPVIGPDSTIYVTHKYGNLIAINPDSRVEEWRYDGGSGYTPFIDSSGIIYV